MFGPRPSLKRAASEVDAQNPAKGPSRIRELRALQRTRSQDDVGHEGSKRRMLGSRSQKAGVFGEKVPFRRNSVAQEFLPPPGAHVPAAREGLTRSYSTNSVMGDPPKVYRPSSFKTFSDGYRFLNPLSILESLNTDSQQVCFGSAVNRVSNDLGISDSESDESSCSLEEQDIEGWTISGRKQNDFDANEELSCFDNCISIDPSRQTLAPNQLERDKSRSNLTKTRITVDTETSNDSARIPEPDHVFITTPQSKKKLRQKRVDFNLLGSKVGCRLVTKISASLPINPITFELEENLKASERSAWSGLLRNAHTEILADDPSAIVFQKSMMNWVYPTNRPSPAHAALISKIMGTTRDIVISSLKPYEQSEVRYLLEQEGEWRLSFQSLYSLYKEEQTKYFYHTTADFSVFFHYRAAISVKPARERVVHVSKASPGLKKALKAAGVAFTSRNVRDPLKLFANARGPEEVFDDEMNPRPSIPAASENTMEDLLEICGDADVERVFTFLANRIDARPDHRVLNRPTLTSPSPFLYSAIRKAKVHIEKVFRKPEQNNGGNGGLREFRSLQVSGVLLPVQAQSVISMVKGCHTGSDSVSAEMHIEYEAQTEGFRDSELID
ncbi:hypothetical protein HDU67_000430 [Dinochytrium kinnereticum]|nr:hypothetical protein HDU67_000430 [Dinochytrium kinnereticum]